MVSCHEELNPSPYFEYNLVAAIEPPAPDVQRERELSDMPIRPEAQLRLQQGFQKRVDQQSRKYASQHQQAVTLATAFHLGELQGIFALKQQNARETIGGILFILLMLCGIFGVPLVGIALNGHPSGATIARSVLFLAVLGGGLVLSGSLWLRPPRYLWLYAFSEGLAVGSAKSIQEHIVRWDHVTEIREVWTNLFSPVSEESVLRCTAYQLRLHDGRAVVVPRTFQNMLDPYRSVGRLISALVPSAVAQAMPSFPVIDDVIKQHLTHHVLPGALAAYQAGRALSFGELTVSTMGVTLRSDQPLLLWSDVKQITMENGALTISRQSSRKPDQLALLEIPNVRVLEVLLNEGLRAQRAGGSSS
jgi:hypothetical protein